MNVGPVLITLHAWWPWHFDADRSAWFYFVWIGPWLIVIDREWWRWRP